MCWFKPPFLFVDMGVKEHKKRKLSEADEGTPNLETTQTIKKKKKEKMGVDSADQKVVPPKRKSVAFSATVETSEDKGEQTAKEPKPKRQPKFSILKEPKQSADGKGKVFVSLVPPLSSLTTQQDLLLIVSENE